MTVILFVALFILLLYPVISNQASAFVTNLPAYIKTAEKDFGSLIADLQHRLGPGVMSQKLRDIAANQAGTVVSFFGSAASNIIGSGFAVVNLLALFIITPIVTSLFSPRLAGHHPSRLFFCRAPRGRDPRQRARGAL